MNEINEEIKQTLNLMQTEVDGTGASNELQYHLMSLLEIKRNELLQRLAKRSWFEHVTHDQAPYKSVKLDGQVADEVKPLTVDELKAGGWWCADTSAAARRAFAVRGFNVADQWELEDLEWELEDLDGCRLTGKESVTRFKGMSKTKDLREITLVDGEFYWGEK